MKEIKNHLPKNLRNLSKLPIIPIEPPKQAKSSNFLRKMAEFPKKLVDLTAICN